MSKSPKATAGLPRIATLHVDTTQGYSGLLAKNGQHVFSYASDVVANDDGTRGISLAMPIRTESYKTTPMLPVFQTILPEGFLANRVVERFSKTLRVDDMALLALTGADSIGRIRLSRTRETGSDTGKVESLKEILSDTGSKDLFEDLCDRYLISSGVAGIQPKVLLGAEDDVEQEKASAAAPRARGGKASIAERSTLRGKRLIIKVSGAEFPNLTENEFHCLSIARSLKLSVPDFWLSADGKRLAIERFDFDGATGGFLGFEDMVSLQGKVNQRKYEGSYEAVALAIVKNVSPGWLQRSLNDYFSAIVLSMVVKNGDAHLKNFGLLYSHPESDDCRLSPIYDVVCTTVYLPKDLPALSLAGRRAWPDRRTLAAFGRDVCRVGDPEAEIDRIIEGATAYRPASGESGIWNRMKAEIHASARGLAQNGQV
ncbi:MAG: type II toxin-antitoxin system HipA family toxin [Deltaproteobacteria bacterium]|nr:type II toxin-antitoxin system HipA family toxin [Deltaproteobacteria bacterium]